MKDKSEMKEYKLFVEGNRFITVDETGGLVGKERWGEGALGFVIQIQSEGGVKHALKVPRLLADTESDNAHINALLAEERRIATQVKTNDAPANSLLLSENESSPFMATTGNDGVIFMCCQKDAAPRFCNVKKSPQQDAPNTLSLTPEIKSLRSVLETIYSDKISIFDQLERDSDGWKSIVATPSNLKQNNGRLTLNRAEDSDTEIWYGAFEGVIYKWANGTLQQAISQKHFANWKCADRLKIIRQIVVGLRHLHRRGFLHGDLRPANIMFSEGGREASQYFITDYGSFAKQEEHRNTLPKENPNADPTQTMEQAVNQQRTSVFYSPERRAGFENELADIAEFHKPEGVKEGIKITLGWKSPLTDKRPSQEDLESDEKTPDIADGDRVRIRDFMFTAKSVAIENGRVALTCYPDVGVIRNDKFIVPMTDTQSLPPSLPIPRTIIFKKWAPPVDVFSVGVLTLYVNYLMPSELVDHLYEKNETPDLEAEFNEMMSRLDSQAYFQDIWRKLTLNKKLSDAILKIASELAPNDVPNMAIKTLIKESEVSSNISGEIEAEDQEKTINDFFEKQVSSFTRATPGLLWLLAGCEGNYIRFIYLFHFSMSCIHRKDSLKDTQPDNEFPFCKSRTDSFKKVQGADEWTSPVNLVLNYLGDPNKEKTSASDTAEPETDLVERVSLPVYEGIRWDGNNTKHLKQFKFDTDKTDYKLRTDNIRLENELSSRKKIIEDIRTNKALFGWRLVSDEKLKSK